MNNNNNNAPENTAIPEACDPAVPETHEESTGTITITVTDTPTGFANGVNLDGNFSGMMFIAGLAAAVNAIVKATGIPAGAVFSKLIEMYSATCEGNNEEQNHEDTDV